MRFKPGTTNAEARAAEAAFNQRQEAYREQQRAMSEANNRPAPQPLTPEQSRIQGIASTMSREPIFDSTGRITGYKPGGMPPGITQADLGRKPITNTAPMPEPPQQNPRMEAVRQKLADAQRRANEISARNKQQRAELEARQAAMRAANNSPRPQPLPQRPMQPQTQPRPPVPPDLQTPMPRPGGTFQADMGRPDMPGRPLAPGATPRPQMGQMTAQQASANAPMFANIAAYDQYMQQATGAGRQGLGSAPMGRPPVPPDLQTPMPRPGGTFQADLGRPDMPVLRGNDGNGNPMGVAANRPMVDSQGRPPPQTVTQVTPIKVPANVTNTYTPKFKKGGKVAAKAPVKKAAGGKVAAKAPVKKAMGGPIKAKTAAKPAAKMAKPMPAMKRGGKVMAKGRKK